MVSLMNLNRVVITGMGLVAGGCLGTASFSERLFSGTSSIGPLTKLQGKNFEGRIAAEIRESFDLRALGITEKQRRVFDGVAPYAFIAAKEAIESAGLLSNDDIKPHEIGLSIGTFCGPISWMMEKAIRWNRTELSSQVHPMAAVVAYFGSIIGNVTIPLKIRGPANSFLSLEIAGTDAIGYAYEAIRYGKARAMLVGGADDLSPYVFQYLDHSGFLSSRSQPAQDGSTWSNGDSDGIVLGEGAALLVLESLDSAVKRGCTIYAEVLGYSSQEGGDAGDGIDHTLKQANVSPAQVECVMMNAAGYGPLDYEEMKHVRRCFNGGSPAPALTGISWAVGHALGAYGAMQAVAAALILKEQRIPPLPRDSGESASNGAGVQGRRATVHHVLQNTLGLSGKSSFLLFASHAQGK
jgi:3-oxoacyl-(acyl-carrier-protein) synthase